MDLAEMIELCIGLLAPFALAWVTYAVLERRFRGLWAGVPLPPVTVRRDAYRGAVVVPGHTQKAPAIVRWAALSCFFLGQMFLPGLALGLVGMLVMGVGLVSIPGLVVAARLWAAGVHLLRGTPDSINKARAAARWSVQLNVLLSIVCVTSGTFCAIQHLRLDNGAYGGGGDLESVGLLALFTQAYAALSLAQAWLIAKATRNLPHDERMPREDVLPYWIRNALARRWERRAYA